MTQSSTYLDLDIGALREAISEEYKVVAESPRQGFHFHTGRPLARLLDYSEDWLANVPGASIESFAGTGNPFSLGNLLPGEQVVDIGSGAGIDSLIASKMVGTEGRVVGVDMTLAMLGKARQSANEVAALNVEFKEGYMEHLPLADGWADVVIPNGVLNLSPDKTAALAEMYRVLNPGGRLQTADILVEAPVPEEAKAQIDLWTG